MSVAILTRPSSPIIQLMYLFALTVLIQALHMVEHVAQVLQKFVLHIAPAHGLIGTLDLAALRSPQFRFRLHQGRRGARANKRSTSGRRIAHPASCVPPNSENPATLSTARIRLGGGSTWKDSAEHSKGMLPK